MRRNLQCVLAAGIALVFAAAPLLAHHSFAAQYDANKPITLKGTVTKMEWMNPHIYFFIDVKDEKTGEVVNWAIEGGAPNVLYRNGWRKDSLKKGDLVTIQGVLARDGSKLANARTVTLADGKRVFAGSSGADGPRP